MRRLLVALLFALGAASASASAAEPDHGSVELSVGRMFAEYALGGDASLRDAGIARLSPDEKLPALKILAELYAVWAGDLQQKVDRASMLLLKHQPGIEIEVFADPAPDAVFVPIVAHITRTSMQGQPERQLCVGDVLLQVEDTTLVEQAIDQTMHPLRIGAILQEYLDSIIAIIAAKHGDTFQVVVRRGETLLRLEQSRSGAIKFREHAARAAASFNEHVGRGLLQVEANVSLIAASDPVESDAADRAIREVLAIYRETRVDYLATIENYDVPAVCSQDAGM